MPSRQGRDPTDDQPGVLDDLEDQAEWSSYTQDIPRLGNPRREHIRLGRYRRAFHGGLHPSGFMRSSMWRVARIPLIAIGVFVVIAGLVTALVE